MSARSYGDFPFQKKLSSVPQNRTVTIKAMPSFPLVPSNITGTKHKILIECSNKSINQSLLFKLKNKIAGPSGDDHILKTIPAPTKK